MKDSRSEDTPLNKVRLLIPMLGFGRFGGHRVLSMLANEIQKNGKIEVSFLVPDCSSPPYFPMHCRIIYCDDRGRVVPGSGKAKTRRAQEIISLARTMRRTKDDFDIILINDSITWIPTLLAGAVEKSVYYIQAYEPDFYKGSWSLKRIILRAASYASYLGVRRQVVNSPLYLNYGPIKATEVVFPGIDLELFHPKDPETFWFRQDRPITIGTVGRQEPIKGTPAALRGIKAFADAGHSIRLRVALGNVPDEFKDLPYLEVIPIESDSELADFYRSLDVLVVAGAEQFGAVHYPTLEGLASGIAVVSTPYSPARKDNCWLVPDPGADWIVTRLTEIQAAREGIFERIRLAVDHTTEFNWSNIGIKMGKIIADFLRGRSS